MLFDNKLLEYDYSVRGTCFAILANGKLFILSSKHGVKDRDPDSLLVPLIPGRRDCLPLCSYNSPKSMNPSVCGVDDFVVWESPIEKYSGDQLRLLSPFSADQHVCNPDDLGIGILGFRGHPSSAKNDIDYDKKHVRTQALASHADFLEPDSYNSGLYWLTFPSSSFPIDSINGMSGSPVFQYSVDANDNVIAKWAGLLIAGSVTAGKAQFIGAHLIHRSLCHMAR